MYVFSFPVLHFFKYLISTFLSGLQRELCIFVKTDMLAEILRDHLRSCSKSQEKDTEANASEKIIQQKKCAYYIWVFKDVLLKHDIVEESVIL